MDQKNPNTAITSIAFRVPAQQRQAFEMMLLKENLRRMYFLSLYVIVIQVLMNIINAVAQSDSATSGDPAISRYYIGLSLFLLTCGVLFAILLRFALKGKITSDINLWLLTNGMLYLILVGQIGFSIVNALTNKSFFSYIIAILIIGAFPVLKPLKSILSILGAFICVFLSMLLHYSLSELRVYFLQVDVWSSIVIITILVGCMSVIIYGMFLSNFMKSTALEAHNAELVDFNKRLEEAANTDAMTGAYNRRALTNFFSALDTEPVRSDRKLVITIFDIDHFKDYNDSYGHIQGDRCLQRISSSLHNSFRRSQDMVYRYGGEEFLVLFETRGENALDLIEQARKEIELLKISHAPHLDMQYVTVSAGYCVVENVTQKAMMQGMTIADEALYDSKKNGRNRSTCGTFPQL